MKLSKGDVEIALIDADIMLYRAAFKHEGGDVEDAYDTIDNMFDHIFHVTKCVSYIAFLTGKGNFRKDIAVTKEYKGNRKDMIMPEHLDDLRDYLWDKWSCKIVNGIEADDALGICQTNLDKTIICSIDKDLLQIEGLHYNWNNKEVKYVNKHEAERLLHLQSLMGDSTDNIVGIPKVGKVKADKILTLGDIGVPHSEICLEAYISYFKDEELGKEKYEETYNLVNIAKDCNDPRFKEPFKIPDVNYIF